MTKDRKEYKRTPPDKTPLYATTAELANILSVHRNTVYRLVKAGLLPEPIRLSATNNRHNVKEAIEAFEKLSQEELAE